MWESEKNRPKALVFERVDTLAICAYGNEIVADTPLWPGNAETKDLLSTIARKLVNAMKPEPTPLSS